MYKYLRGNNKTHTNKAKSYFYLWSESLISLLFLMTKCSSSIMCMLNRIFAPALFGKVHRRFLKSIHAENYNEAGFFVLNKSTRKPIFFVRIHSIHIQFIFLKLYNFTKTLVAPSYVNQTKLCYHKSNADLQRIKLEQFHEPRTTFKPSKKHLKLSKADVHRQTK